MASPSPDRMNIHAIAVLEDAAQKAEIEPIKPTPAMRLALSWLTLNRVADRWQVDAFWTAATKPYKNPDDPHADYMRNRDMRIMIDAWKRKIGQPL